MSIQLSHNLENIYIYQNNIELVKAKNHEAQKLGLLNHKKLDETEGLLFFKRRVFHTFGMRFPICILAFDKERKLISRPISVNPNHVFICPRKAKYVAEVNQKFTNVNYEFKTQNKIYVLNFLKSKIIFYFVKTLPILLIFLSILLTFSSAFGLDPITINLGKTRTIHLELPPDSIQIDDPDIIDIERVGISNSIKLTPKQIGKTNLTFQYSDGHDETLNINIVGTFQNLEDLLQNSLTPKESPSFEFENGLNQIKAISGVQHSVSSGKIFILGKIQSIEKFKEISKIVAPNPKIFFPSFEIEEKILNQVLYVLNKDIRNMGENNLSIIQHGDQFFLKGVSSSKTQKDKIWSYLSAILPNIIDSTASFLGESSLVQINLEFFEVGRNNKEDSGFEYPTLGTAGTGFQINSYSGNKPSFQIAPFSVFFRALSARSYVKEIARPVIITRSGEKATFLAGGEVPIPIVTTNGPNTNVSVSFKSVGILFDATPRVNDDGTIWITLNIEYSQINEKLSYQSAPGFNSRKISTNIILSEGSAAIISGLIQNIELKKSENVRLLSNIPIIGELFQSKQYGNNSTELIIAISAIQKKVQ